MVCLLCAWCLVPAFPAFGQDANATVPPETIDVGRDGSIGHDGVVTRYWQVNHEQPAELQKELQTYVGKDVQITARGLNSLRIDAPLEKWPIVEKLLEVLDEPAPQVFVEAKIIEIRYDTNLEFGWEGYYDRRKATDGAQPFFGSFVGAFNPESYLEAIGTDQPFQGGTFDFKTVGDSVEKHGEYAYVFRALQERGMVEILSQPSIIATQGKKATITTGKRFPVQSVEVRGTQTIVTTKFEQTGIKLEIDPKLIGRSFVTLGIDATDSQITDYVPGPEGSLNPVISERSAKSEVGVRDGETIIIGGLLSTATLEGKSGLPIISDIPLIGYLFSSFQSQETKAELVFFITPRIIKRREQTVILPPAERARAGLR
jgi:type II secretory pathway component GspD/PulD (secretin)